MSNHYTFMMHRAILQSCKGTYIHTYIHTYIQYMYLSKLSCNNLLVLQIMHCLDSDFCVDEDEVGYFVTADTISKCFRKAGILDTELGVICRGAVDNDPFLE